MTDWYKAITMKEIYWKGKTYRDGEKINLIKEDVVILSDAGIIGSIEKIDFQDHKEFAVRDSPEDQKIRHKRGRKPNYMNQNNRIPG